MMINLKISTLILKSLAVAQAGIDIFSITDHFSNELLILSALLSLPILIFLGIRLYLNYRMLIEFSYVAVSEYEDTNLISFRSPPPENDDQNKAA